MFPHEFENMIKIFKILGKRRKIAKIIYFCQLGRRYILETPTPNLWCLSHINTHWDTLEPHMQPICHGTTRFSMLWHKCSPSVSSEANCVIYSSLLRWLCDQGRTYTEDANPKKANVAPCGPVISIICSGCTVWVINPHPRGAHLHRI